MAWRGAALSFARTFRARDPRPAGVKVRRHSHATRTREPRGNSISFLSVAEEMPLSSGNSHFYTLSYGRPRRIDIQLWPFIIASRELGGDRAVPFCSVPYLTVRIHNPMQRGAVAAGISGG